MSENEAGARVPYSQRPEWADMEPVWVADKKVVAIQYKQEDAEALAYFRAVLAKGERSERVLKLTQHIIDINDADYTAWQLRWECCQALQSDLADEDQLTRSIVRSNSKNYQLWNHRRKLAAAWGPAAAEQELKVTELALDRDAKNYHAWAHRQYVVQQARLWERELAYVDKLLQEDVRNNSAWNQRLFVLQHMPAPAGGVQERLLVELYYVADKLHAAPDNQSAWNYLSGLFQLRGLPEHHMGACSEVHTICFEALSDSPSCAPALDTLAQYYLHLACLAAQQGQTGPAQDAASNAVQLLQKAVIADPIRANYWQHRMDELREGFALPTEQPEAA